MGGSKHINGLKSGEIASHIKPDLRLLFFMNISGTIHEIGLTEKVTNSLRKRELIIEYAENPQYPEFIKIEAINDKCDILDNFQEGQTVSVDFNLRGRPWTDKTGKKTYFNSLSLWKIN